MSRMNIVSPISAVIKNSRSKQISTAVGVLSNSLNIRERATNPVINEAEKIVGYPTSFLSLRWLLNDEVANIALHLRRLIGTNHPLLQTAKDLIIHKQSPNWGLIVLLVSKAGGIKKEYSRVDCDITAGILHSQRVLAEITEMIRTSNIIHKSILHIHPDHPDFKDVNFGNKLSLLTGDYLLSTSFKELAALKNHDVNEFISTCLRDLTEAQFIEPRDKQNRPLPARPLTEEKLVKIPNRFEEETLQVSEVLGRAKAEWTLRHLLDGASLLAKCCQSTLLLAEHPKSFQELGYVFGRNMALAWQASKDRIIFDSNRKERFSLVCAPLLFHLQFDTSYYDTLMEDVQNDTVNYDDLRKIVRSGPGLQKTIELQEEFCLNALKVLEQFPKNEARNSLVNIVNAIS